jgi:RNA polymerase sigma factor (sigma-70 family)
LASGPAVRFFSLGLNSSAAQMTLMRHNVEFEHIEAPQRVRNLVERLVARLDRRAKGFPQDAVFLRLVVEEKPAHSLYNVSLTVDLPGTTLAAKEENHDIEAGVRSVFAAVERQLTDHKGALRRERLWKLLAREKIRQTKSDAPAFAPRDAKSFFALISPHLNGLTDFVNHELAYAEATGDLARGELSSEDIVDTVLLRAYRESVQQPVREEVRSWLLKLAIEHLEAEINRSKSERVRKISIEKDIPETPPTEAVSTLGDEILDFYQPDEDLKLEDTVPDPEVPTPEDETATKELRQCVAAALRTMPREYRRLLVLRYVQALGLVELARAVGKSRPEVDRTLEEARGYLRQRIIESGCSVQRSGSRTSGGAAH